LAERQPAGVVLSVGSARLGQIYESILAARRLQTVTARRDDESRIELGFWKSSSRVLWVSAPFWHPLSICLRDPTECSSNKPAPAGLFCSMGREQNKAFQVFALGPRGG